MVIQIPHELFQSTRMTEQEFWQEIAVMLFEKEKLTLGQASRLAKISQFQFQHLLASRHIPIHYGIEELEEDLATLKKLGRL